MTVLAQLVAESVRNGGIACGGALLHCKDFGHRELPWRLAEISATCSVYRAS